MSEYVPKIGDRIEVFNQVGNNWFGFVRAINKKSLRVECEQKYLLFTHHRDARAPYDDGRHFQVPSRDILPIDDPTP